MGFLTGAKQSDQSVGLGKELSGLKAQLSAISEELKKVETLEKSLAYHEIVLAKKVAEMHSFEERLGRSVKSEHLDEVKRELGKIQKHEEVLFENSKYIREALNEIQKVKDSHRLTGERSEAKAKAHKTETEENMGRIKKAIEEMEAKRRVRRKQILGALQDMKKTYDAKLEMIEEQNKDILRRIARLERK
ncbi:hypothetical protein JW826_03090 [Candidatus Woesearchaeota archaeon]|nr:hypothetical protein [Candidatus Woesearchaeota archaeon]